MYKIIKVILILTIFIINIAGITAAEINTYEELVEELKHTDGNTEIDIKDNLDADCGLGTLTRENAEIHGNGYYIDGNGNNGLILRGNSACSIDSFNAKNFNSAKGGVLLNDSGCSLNHLDGNFENNYSLEGGGAIYNSSTINNIVANFISNSSESGGGAIYNDYSGYINVLEGNFENNYSDRSVGGAIFNYGIIDKISANFSSNYTLNGNGGAISNMGDIKDLQGDFIGNYALLTGGAIDNSGIIENLSGNFIGNTAGGTFYGGGGAIMNYNTIENLSGIFLNNTSNSLGGAIHNIYGTINLMSKDNPIYFEGNTDSTGSNAICNESGTINFYSENNPIIINDKVTGSNTYGSEAVININPENTSGDIFINNDWEGNTVNQYNGNLNFGSNIQGDIKYSGNFLQSLDYNFYGGGVNLRNEELGNTALGNLSLYGDLNLMLDCNLEDELADTISAYSFNSNGHFINITDLEILSDITEKPQITISPISEDIDEEVRETLKNALRYTGANYVDTPIYKYRVEYDSQNGVLVFNRVEETTYDSFNPEVLAAGIAAQIGGYLTQINSYNNAFRNMDKYMLLPLKQRIGIKYRNKYASIDNSYPYKDAAPDFWINPYTTFEKVPLKNGPKVSNISYGNFFGEESDFIELKHDWDFIWSPYIGYNGSNQSYEGVDINQNGGVLGVLGMFYKENFYSGITVNASANGCEATSPKYKDDFAMLMAGIASKTGYNIELKEGKFIIQPNFLISYTFVKSFDYKDSYDVKINSKFLNAIQVAPGIQLIGNINKVWQPYINVSMVWNIIDKTNFKANDVTLPQLSIKPFVVYGAGIRKIWNERSSGFAQAYVTNGGRNGVGLQFGFRWEF